jgi:16S rRNA (cytosine1402-N4)-methyltransferase
VNKRDMLLQTEHQSVMLAEAINALSIKPEGIYVDATYGRGGHSAEILKYLNSNGRLIAIDKDPLAIKHAQEYFQDDARMQLFHGSFARLEDFVTQAGVKGKVNGILFDLGMSSPQLNQADRGFSFMREGPLDMRMDTSSGLTAAEWLSQVSERELEKVLREYGEERYAKRIAAAIVEERKQKNIDTTKQLAAIVAAASPFHDPHKHPATRSFQAIRIFINQELEELESTLKQALDVLAIGGRLVVISFHSLEDRMVKQFIAKHAKGEEIPRKLPILGSNKGKRLLKLSSAIQPSDIEVKQNLRARSAVLRIAEKIS